MRTPQEFTNNVKNGIITTEMLNACLYSANKRAKNYRDAKREYKRRHYSCKYVDSATKKEEDFYRKKDMLLSIIQPVCIHKECVGYERIRIYDYESDFDERYLQALLLNQVVYTNTYYEYDAGGEVFFFDRCDLSKPKFLYFLFYEIGENSYHTPIYNPPEEYDLPIVVIGRLNTDGKDYHDLISVQFIDKVISLVKSGKYEYRETEKTVSQNYCSDETPTPGLSDVNDEEVRFVVKPYVSREMTLRCQQMYEGKEYAFTEADFTVRQKYNKKKHMLKAPVVKLVERITEPKFVLTDDILVKLCNAVSKPGFKLSTAVKIICDEIPPERYETCYKDMYMQKLLRELQKTATELYNLHAAEKKPLLVTMQDVISEYRKIKSASKKVEV